MIDWICDVEKIRDTNLRAKAAVTSFGARRRKQNISLRKIVEDICPNYSVMGVDIFLFVCGIEEGRQLLHASRSFLFSPPDLLRRLTRLVRLVRQK